MDVTAVGDQKAKLRSQDDPLIIEPEEVQLDASGSDVICDDIPRSDKNDSLDAGPSGNGNNSGKTAESGKIPPDAERKSKKKPKTLYSFLLLSSHIVVKRQIRMYKCDVCGATYRHVFSLKRHFLRNHVAVEYISNSDLSNCKINVAKTLDEVAGSDSDISSVSSQGSSAKKKEDVNEVFESDQNGNMSGLYRCHLCKDTKFDTKSELKVHFQKHPNSSKLRFPCDKCDAVFPHKQTLFRHLTSHSGVSTFPCTHCGKSFDSKSAYQKHAATHTEGNMCKYCKKILSTKANKRRHERIHEGLKPYPCKHCGSQFGQSLDLKKHMKRQHGVPYLTCPYCTGMFSSRNALNKHVADRHAAQVDQNIAKQSSPVKLGEQTFQNTPGPIENLGEIHFRDSQAEVVTAQRAPAAAAAPKVYSCKICKKTCYSYVTMMCHRRKNHPFLHGKARKLTRKPKYYAKNNSRQKVIPKRSPARLTEEEFYRSMSKMIADNLLNHVDGKTSQLSLRQYNFSEQVEHSVIPSLKWSSYNFPSSFDVDLALKTKGHEIKNRNSELPSLIFDGSVTNGFSSFRENCDGVLDYSNYRKSSSDHDQSDSDEYVIDDRTRVDYRNINIEERKKLIGREVQVIVLCSVCREKFSSHEAFNAHAVNNHPNVHCTFVEIEGDEKNPPVVPEDMRWHFLNPTGVYFSCFVPPPISGESSVTCTKCGSTFPRTSDLHLHAFSCAGNVSTACHVRKRFHERKIKRTMKNRIDTALKPSIVKRNSPKVPHPVEGNLSSSSKISKVLKTNTVPSFSKPTVGRPRSNLCINCPHCKKSFRTKGLMNAHKNRCYKRVVMKNNRLKLPLIKVDTSVPKTRGIPLGSADVPSATGVELLPSGTSNSNFITSTCMTPPVSATTKCVAPEPRASTFSANRSSVAVAAPPGLSALPQSGSTFVPPRSSTSVPAKPIKLAASSSGKCAPVVQASTSSGMRCAAVKPGLSSGTTGFSIKLAATSVALNALPTTLPTVKSLLAPKGSTPAVKERAAAPPSDASSLSCKIPTSKISVAAKMPASLPSFATVEAKFALTVKTSVKVSDSSTIPASASNLDSSDSLSRSSSTKSSVLAPPDCTASVICGSPTQVAVGSTAANNSALHVSDEPSKEDTTSLPAPLNTQHKIDAFRERLSPSLEVIVNSIKEKLTSEELSPSHPPFSWMDDEHLVMFPSTSQVSVEKTKVVEVSHEAKPTVPSPKAEVAESPCDESATSRVEVQGSVSDEGIVEVIPRRVSVEDHKDESSPCTSVTDRIVDSATKSDAAENSCESHDPGFAESKNPQVTDVEVVHTHQSEKDCGGNREERRESSKGMETRLRSSEIIATGRKRPVSSIGVASSSKTSHPMKRRAKSSSLASVNGETRSVSDASSSSVPAVAAVGIKDEKPNFKHEIEKEQLNQCPYCRLHFAYLTNFHRHISKCRRRTDGRESDPAPQNSGCMLVLPKKDEVEASMLNLLRNQSRQSQMMKEAKLDDPDDVKRFQTYTCDSCHRIFLSLFKLLQHRVVHKLQSTDDQPASSNDGNSTDKAQEEAVAATIEVAATDTKVEPVVPDGFSERRESPSAIKDRSNEVRNSFDSSEDGEVVLGHAFKDLLASKMAEQAAKSVETVDGCLESASPAESEKCGDSSLNGNTCTLNEDGVKGCDRGEPVDVGEDVVEEQALPSSSRANHCSSSKHTKKKPTSSDRTCPICKKVFYSVNYKNRHLETKHGKKKVVAARVDKTSAGKMKPVSTKKASLKTKKRRAFKRECKKQVFAKKSVIKKSILLGKRKK